MAKKDNERDNEVKELKTLDESKPYCVIFGHDEYAYEQDGSYFNEQGIEVR